MLFFSVLSLDGLIDASCYSDGHSVSKGKIPSALSLADTRQTRAQPLERKDGTEIGFSTDAESDVIFPAHLDQPLFRLGGTIPILLDECSSSISD